MNDFLGDPIILVFFLILFILIVGFLVTFINRRLSKQWSENQALQINQMGLRLEQQWQQLQNQLHDRVHNTLETRITSSFHLVSQQLEQVHRGLGEMGRVAEHVGDLKRILSQNKTRGVFGEFQLIRLLEQILAPQQYEKNVAMVPGSNERVEVAIRIPQGTGNTIYLPIDAKFPLENYMKLQDAQSQDGGKGSEPQKKALAKSFFDEALKIKKKYVQPPHTTEVALMYLPTEGLYWEIIQLPEVLEQMYRIRVIPVGPSTLFAVLSGFYMAFQTLSINIKASEITKILENTKLEISKFSQIISEIKNKLDQAQGKVDDASVRLRATERILKHIETTKEDQPSI